MQKSCFYHDLANSYKIAIYRVIYRIGYAPELDPSDREICGWCYRFLTKKIDIYRELAELKTIRLRHPRLIYIEPSSNTQEVVVVYKTPTNKDFELEKEQQRDRKQMSEVFSIHAKE